MADTIDAMAYSGGKGMADQCHALARSLRDTAMQWGRMGAVVGGEKK